MNRTRSTAAWLGAFALTAVLPGCMGGARRVGGADAAASGDGGNAAAAGGSDEVSLTDADLAPMDAYVRRRRWILGDEADVTASKEYFAPVLSITERIGIVRREDSISGSDAVIVLTYMGPTDQMDIQTAPRVMIGTGLSIMARKRLVVRLVKTTSTDLPVRLDVRVQGKASTGAGSDVIQRADALTLGARLRRGPGGGYVFEGN